MRDCQSLKANSSAILVLKGLDVSSERPEKYIAQTLLLIVNLRRYQALEESSTCCRGRERPLRGPRSCGLRKMLINEQSFPTILEGMPGAGWNPRALNRPSLIQGRVEHAFENFVKQKWKDALNLTVGPLGFIH
jgi:hypothetical protein